MRKSEEIMQMGPQSFSKSREVKTVQQVLSVFAADLHRGARCDEAVQALTAQLRSLIPVLSLPRQSSVSKSNTQRSKRA
jgi:hypothetical protein